MRPEDFDVQQLVKDLQGTCNDIPDYLPEGMDEYDLTDEDHEFIDQEIFHCTVCGWWYEISEESGKDESELICQDCAEDE